MPDLIGQRLGQYEIVALLGEGGMATVYRAHQLMAGRVARDVAVKVIEACLARTPEFIARFEREAQTLISLSHPHILKVFEYGQQGDLLYPVMELLSGGSLAKRVQKGALPLDSVLRIADQIGRVLRARSGCGVFHNGLDSSFVTYRRRGHH